MSGDAPTGEAPYCKVCKVPDRGKAPHNSKVIETVAGAADQGDSPGSQDTLTPETQTSTRLATAGSSEQRLEEIATSTPNRTDYTVDALGRTTTRQESALLRIQTIIRAAKTAKCMELTGAAGEPAEMERDRSELCSFFDDRSVCSVGAEGGGLLSELPQRANAVLQSVVAGVVGKS